MYACTPKIFKDKPKLFNSVAKGIFPGQFTPTTMHFLLRLMHEKGVLTRLFTQNIDTMERLVRSKKKKQCTLTSICPNTRGNPSHLVFLRQSKPNLGPKPGRIKSIAPLRVRHSVYAIVRMPLLRCRSLLFGTILLGWNTERQNS